MKIRKYGSDYIVRFEKDEEIIATLTQVAEKMRVTGAWFHGIGVGRDIILGYFDAHRKTYLKKLYEGEYEFTSLSGNISYHGQKSIIHCHATITDSTFTASGGHLFQALVPATLELFIVPLTKKLKRKHDDQTGLFLLDL